MIVSVPASSANLGAGFDSLGLAVDIPFHLADQQFDLGRPPLELEEGHPAMAAYVAAGGTDTELWWSSAIPPGRGLGFSGASRVAGAFVAYLQLGHAEAEAVSLAFALASKLEGHPDNAAASAFGGLAVAAGQTVIPIEVPDDLVIAVWWPNSETSTDKSRTTLRQDVPMADAVFNLSRSALFVAAIASGRYDALLEATQDKLHQDVRFESSPESLETLGTFLDNGAHCAWLSGSGPTIAALVSREDAESFEERVEGRDLTITDIAKSGASIVNDLA